MDPFALIVLGLVPGLLVAVLARGRVHPGSGAQERAERRPLGGRDGGA